MARSPKTINAVCETLRARIRFGQWQPRARIPRKLDLAAELGVSDGTVQHALSRLAEEGFLNARGCLGTFVSELPPHLHAFGLVLIDSNPANIWAESLRRAATAVAAQSSVRFRIYQLLPALHDAIRAITDDLAAGRVAGLLLAAPPGYFKDSCVLGYPTPRVFIGGGGRPADGSGDPVITYASPFARAVEHFAAAGRKRLAVFASVNQTAYKSSLEPLLALAERHRIEVRPEWVFPVSPLETIAATSAHLLMTLPAARRPDAIYITDDHLAVEVTRGLARSGLDFKRTVSVLTHANAPCLQPTAVPTAYLGYDSVRIIRLGVTRIERLIRGERHASENSIQAEFFSR